MPSAQTIRDFQAASRDWTGAPLKVDGQLGPRTRWAMAIADLPRWRRDVVRRATDMHGACESPNGSNRGEWVDAFLRPAGIGLGHPWCAAFVSWVFRECGLLEDVPGGYHVSAAKLLRALPAQIGEPTPGDVFGWVNPDGTGHVGFVLGAANRLNVLATIEGNSENRVRCCWRPRASLQIATLEPLLEAPLPIVTDAPMVERAGNTR